MSGIITQAPRMPVKTTRLQMADGYECFWVDVRTNIRRDVMLGFIKLDLDSTSAALENIIVAWNLADDDGVPLPITFETIRSLQVELFDQIGISFMALFNKETSVPKALAEPSASSSRVNAEE